MLDLPISGERYQLNGIKSVVLVFGEAAKIRERRHALRVWKLGESSLEEVDKQHHLGILRRISNSIISHTNERATAARSAT